MISGALAIVSLTLAFWGVAIVAPQLVLGGLLLSGLFATIAIIFGIQAMKEGDDRGKWFGLAGLVLGGVIAIYHIILGVLQVASI